MRNDWKLGGCDCYEYLIMDLSVHYSGDSSFAACVVRRQQITVFYKPMLMFSDCHILSQQLSKHENILKWVHDEMRNWDAGTRGLELFFFCLYFLQHNKCAQSPAFIKHVFQHFKSKIICCEEFLLLCIALWSLL